MGVQESGRPPCSALSKGYEQGDPRGSSRSQFPLENENVILPPGSLERTLENIHPAIYFEPENCPVLGIILRD